MLSTISGTCEFLRLKTRIVFGAGFLCLTGALLTILTFSTSAKASVYDPAYAAPPYICTTGTGCCSAAQMPSLIHEMFTGTGLYTGQQDLQNYYYLNSLWPKIHTALKKLSDDLHNSITVSLGPRGAFMDAQSFNLSLIALEKSSVESLVTQTTSDQICRFGTLSRSLADSADKTRAVQLGLASQMLQREVMRSGLSSAFEKTVGSQLGRASDKTSRLDQYKKVFCDPKDSNESMTGVCINTTDVRSNADIDITRTLFNPLTLQLDFSPSGVATKTNDEENLMAMANNLFAHNLPLNFSNADFDGIYKDSGDVSDSRKERLMDYRALTAKRTVAQNSFAALAAMKAEGSGASSTYVKKMVEYLGLSAADQSSFVGANPSYYAQMELLTRKLYQSPEFYANLMESPSNVARQQTAMEGIGLMQDRDIHESLRRSEMVLSTLLEMYVIENQDKSRDRGTK